MWLTSCGLSDLPSHQAIWSSIPKISSLVITPDRSKPSLGWRIHHNEPFALKPPNLVPYAPLFLANFMTLQSRFCSRAARRAIIVDQVEAAFRRMAIQYHPDWNRSSLWLNRGDQDRAIELLCQARLLLHEPFLVSLAQDRVRTAEELAKLVYWCRPPLDHECMFCGAQPARSTTLLHQESFGPLHYQARLDGSLCRLCGLAFSRRMQLRTMWAGWWGLPGALRAPFVLVKNARARHQLRRLKPPAPPDSLVVSLLATPLGQPATT